MVKKRAKRAAARRRPAKRPTKLLDPAGPFTIAELERAIFVELDDSDSADELANRWRQLRAWMQDGTLSATNHSRYRYWVESRQLRDLASIYGGALRRHAAPKCPAMLETVETHANDTRDTRELHSSTNGHVASPAG